MGTDEQSSEQKLLKSIGIYTATLLLSVAAFTIANRRNRRMLLKSIHTDNLTGILNRDGFKSEAASLLHSYPDNRYCLIEFDIDDFKFLNTSYGYEQGDRLLCALADCIQSKYNGDQLSARIASDDFVILVKQGPELVDELRNLLADTLCLAFLNISEFITFTVGAYEIPEDCVNIQTVMDKANMAHKNAKTEGKSMSLWYDERFLKIRNAEALVRWEIPDEGTVCPDQFIPLFERNGSIAEIDFYILEKACAYIRKYLDTFGTEFHISVNFSRVTIYQQRCYSTILEITDRFQIPHNCIEIEITESAFNGISEVIV